jgi:hypothetical protein
MSNCFVVMGHSKGSNGGNYFWYMRNADGSITRNCGNPNVTSPANGRGQNGCPANGRWAG